MTMRARGGRGGATRREWSERIVGELGVEKVS